jgi:large subunit ribosomal protein L7Ae
MPGKEKKPPAKAASKAAAPYKKAAEAKPAAKPAAATQESHTQFASRPKNFGVGQETPYKRDISRFMRWPTFVTRQRKKRVLQRRLKIPASVNQFSQVLDRSTRNELMKVLKKYAPETRKERSQRIAKAAGAKAKDSKKTAATKKPVSIVSGIQEVTRAIENNKAKLVVISNNVDPIELVLWLPALCRANKVPYAIIKDKARLGEAIHQKTCTAVAVTEVRPEDETALKNLIRSVNARFLSRTDAIRRQWGGLQLSLRSRAAARKKRARASTKLDSVA